MKVAIIGGGASGLACAITLKRLDSNIDVTIFEKLDRPGKKLLATGNGRCNLSNFVISEEYYNGDHEIMIAAVLDEFDAVEALRFFSTLGLKIRDEDGRLYPYSMSASNVVTILTNEAKALKVKIKTGCKAETLDSKLKINGKEKFDAVVLALGGKAAPQHGTDGDGYKILKSLGIKYHPITPALVQIKTEEDLKELKGIRFKGVLFLRIHPEIHHSLCHTFTSYINIERLQAFVKQNIIDFPTMGPEFVRQSGRLWAASSLRRESSPPSQEGTPEESSPGRRQSSCISRSFPPLSLGCPAEAVAARRFL